MEITDFDNTKNMNNDEWTFLLFLLFMQDLQNKNETWERFENDLIYKNRFTSDSPIVEELKKRSEQATRHIPNKSIFYRARSFKHSSFDKLLRLQSSKVIATTYPLTRRDFILLMARLTQTHLFLGANAQMLPTRYRCH